MRTYLFRCLRPGDTVSPGRGSRPKGRGGQTEGSLGEPLVPLIVSVRLEMQPSGSLGTTMSRNIFMWGFQPHFRISAQVRATSVFSALTDALDSDVLLGRSP